MSLLRKPVIGGAAFVAAMVGALSCASAADMPGNPPLSLPAPSRPLHRVEVASGWYLRGDLGYRMGRLNSAQPAPGFAAPTDDKMGNSIVAGLGGGIKTEWLRTDVTIDFATPMKYEAPLGGTSAKVSATTFLFNGYLDLGTWYRATPYIGAGAGTARMSVSDYTSTALPPFTGDTARTRWNFAWAGMAGVAYAISPNTMVDLGYRYINFGDVTTGSDVFGSMTLKQIAAHEVRVGLRWSFDDLSMAR
ncbi:MAG: porin family protein [Pseudolabrys sp.]|nr:porin family protein [Pseudolabrys sp.]MDP2295177.1 porin family protein [Pseudolabrys sp.]